jgi:AcrR family transcriptional regulator
MTTAVDSVGTRKPRADAERNRRRLLDEARQAFSDRGAAASLEEIARTAGVGIGTLYRHFPTRHALVEQVYRDEARQLAEAASRLTQEVPPLEALRRWLLLFIDYMVTKQSLAELLNDLPDGPDELYALSTALVRDAVALLIEHAMANGAARAVTIEPLDLLRALAGVAKFSSGPEWAANARNLVDILVAGIRTSG